MTPALQGFSHVALSVPTLGPSREFLQRILGFHDLVDGPGVCMLLHPQALVAVALTDNGGRVEGTFSETHPGLDHLALAVADEATLHAWQRHLHRHGVEHTPVAATEMGWHLNLRTPDGLPVELYAMAPAMREIIGIALDVAPVAHAHPSPGRPSPD